MSSHVLSSLVCVILHILQIYGRWSMPFPPVDISVLAEEHLADVGIAGLGGKVESGPDIISDKFIILRFRDF